MLLWEQTQSEIKLKQLKHLYNYLLLLNDCMKVQLIVHLYANCIIVCF